MADSGVLRRSHPYTALILFRDGRTTELKQIERRVIGIISALSSSILNI